MWSLRCEPMISTVYVMHRWPCTTLKTKKKKPNVAIFKSNNQLHALSFQLLAIRKEKKRKEKEGKEESREKREEKEREEKKRKEIERSLV